ncbi:MAG: GGDEF domain-containing protein [Sphingopyxis sp.]
MEHWTPNSHGLDDALESLAAYSADMMTRVSPEGIYLYVSPSAAHIFGRSVDAVVGRHMLDFIYEPDKPKFIEAVTRFRDSGSETFDFIVRALHSDGRVLWVEIASRLIGDPALGLARDRAALVRDITERKLMEDQLRRMALTDGLTGLMNRRAFDDNIVASWLSVASRNSELSLLLIDIDHFKMFNDSFGHQTGDDCLRAVAQALAALPVSADSMVARYGGEEMAIILPDTDAAAAADLAEQARSAVAALSLPQCIPAVRGQNVTVSIGCATALVRPGGSHEMPHTLIAAADRLLYLAKDKGRNRVEATMILGSPG